MFHTDSTASHCFSLAGRAGKDVAPEVGMGDGPGHTGHIISLGPLAIPTDMGSKHQHKEQMDPTSPVYTGVAT